jgi:pimeloyl-ACP methyl ester carboxylesterase
MAEGTDVAATWILLRGLGREKGHWGTFVDRLTETFPKDKILPLDLPGTGELHAMHSPGHLSEICTFMRAQVDNKARSGSPRRLVALSLGGMVAMEWMRQSPGDLASCVLVNSSSPESPIYNRLRWQIWSAFARLVAQPVVRERERAIINLVMNNPEAREIALPLWTKIAIEHPLRVLNILQQLRAATTARPLHSAPSVPVLILSGLGDRLVDPSCSEKLHARWGWPIHRHPWAGHDLTWDDPEWVLRMLKRKIVSNLLELSGAAICGVKITLF